MVFIIPFESEFSGEIRKIYAVNNDNPQNSMRGSTTLSEKCPHCNERNFYRVYEHREEREEDGWFIEVYDCKCPACRKTFDLEVEHEV